MSLSKSQNAYAGIYEGLRLFPVKRLADQFASWLQIVVWLGMVFICMATSEGQPLKPSTPGEFRANFIQQIAIYTTWPENVQANPSVPFRVGLLGGDQYGDGLMFLERLGIKNRKVQVVQFDSVEEVKGVQILFISDSERRRISKVLASLKGSSILTIADQQGFLQKGGMINFVERKVRGQTRLRFEINRTAAGAEKIKFAAVLLKSAQKVEG
jgi:hypothetical protein